jgi:hypothetical protein
MTCTTRRCCTFFSLLALTAATAVAQNAAAPQADQPKIQPGPSNPAPQVDEPPQPQAPGAQPDVKNGQPEIQNGQPAVPEGQPGLIDPGMDPAVINGFDPGFRMYGPNRFP